MQDNCQGRFLDVVVVCVVVVVVVVAAAAFVLAINVVKFYLLQE